jgi:hypothetical protein
MELPDVPRPDHSSGSSYARISPDGRTIVMHLANTHLVFGAVEFDANELPIGVHLGTAFVPGTWISIGRWSNDGRHYVLSDTEWGPEPGRALMAGAGRLISIEVDGLAGRVVSQARVSLAPEAIEMNRAGDLFVAVNMEQTYLPEYGPYLQAPRRKRGSLSLVAFDAANGQLRTVDGPLGFDGVLPEDAVFDRDGDMLAVAIFHDREAVPMDGWIELFSVDRSGASPRLAPTGKRIRTPRGVHDLAVTY